MTLNKAILRVSSDVDGDGSVEDGEFHMRDVEVSPSLRTGFLIGGRGSTINNVIAQTVGAGDSKRRQFFLEEGGGAHTIEISFRSWEGSDETWGDPSEPVGSQANASGEQPIAQVDVLMKYLLTAEIDSRAPATLEYGEYSESGRFSPLPVVLEGPQMTRAAEDGSWFDGSMTCIAAADIQQVFDAAARRLR
jgi:hypothetical protein